VQGPKLIIIPLDLDEANELVERWHRHSDPVLSHKFSVGVFDVAAANVCGAAIAGRPVARGLDNGWTLEVYRVVTDGTRNACSALYGACRRIGFAMGYRRIVTYTRKDETGASLVGAGWKVVGETKGGSWDCPSRPRVTKHTGQKTLWEAQS